MTPHVDTSGKEKLGVAEQAAETTRLPNVRRALLSISLSPEILDIREELAKVAVISVVSCFVNANSVIEILPSVITVSIAGPITPLNDCTFLVPLASKEEVKLVCKMEKVKASTKDGVCMLKLSPWSAELGVDGRAEGTGRWILIWNLPLHGWCWCVIAEVLKLVGELISLSHAGGAEPQFWYEKVCGLVNRGAEYLPHVPVGGGSLLSY